VLSVYSKFSQILSESYFEYSMVLKGYSLRFFLEVRVKLDNDFTKKICGCKFPSLNAHLLLV
jgi:hypothetical protein